MSDDQPQKPEQPRSPIFDRIHRSPQIPDRYAERRAVSR